MWLAHRLGIGDLGQVPLRLLIAATSAVLPEIRNLNPPSGSAVGSKAAPQRTPFPLLTALETQKREKDDQRPQGGCLGWRLRPRFGCQGHIFRTARQAFAERDVTHRRGTWPMRTQSKFSPADLALSSRHLPNASRPTPAPPQSIQSGPAFAISPGSLPHVHPQRRAPPQQKMLQPWTKDHGTGHR